MRRDGDESTAWYSSSGHADVAFGLEGLAAKLDRQEGLHAGTACCWVEPVLAY